MIQNKTTTILVDADEVVYECVPALVNWFKEKYGKNYTVDELAGWGTHGDFRDKKFEAFADPAFVLSQPLYEGAQKFVKELQKRGNVVFCTAVDGNCLTVRAAALKRDFGIDAGNVITASRKDLVKADFLIDDSPYNIRRSNCEYPILFRRKGSEAVSGALSATKYEDILTIIDFVQNRKAMNKIPSNGILCLVGPTGAGKTEMTEKLTERGYKTFKAVSTSKSKRYRHVNAAEFEKKVQNNEMAEYTVYGGNYYGLTWEDVNDLVKGPTQPDADKIPAVFAVDMCGAMALKNIFGNRVALVFCDANRMECIKNILSRNMTQDEKAIRLAGLEAEFGNERFCDFTVRGADDLLASV